VKNTGIKVSHGCRFETLHFFRWGIFEPPGIYSAASGIVLSARTNNDVENGKRFRRVHWVHDRDVCPCGFMRRRRLLSAFTVFSQ